MGFFEWLASVNVFARLTTLETKLRKIEGDIKTMATELEQFQAALKRIDDATNAIAAELTALKGQITAAGLDAATEQSILTALTAAADKLEGIGKPVDPAPPVA